MSAKQLSASPMGGDECSIPQLCNALEKINAADDSHGGEAVIRLLEAPSDIGHEVGSHLDYTDLQTLRLASHAFDGIVDHAFIRRLNKVKMLYPTQESLQSWHDLAAVPQLASRIRELHIVKDSVLMPYNGIHWGKESMFALQNPNVKLTKRDNFLLVQIEGAHYSAHTANYDFTVNDHFYIELTRLIAKLENLQFIHCHPLEPGKHIPGWMPQEYFTLLPAKVQAANFNGIFYNDWKDAVHPDSEINCLNDVQRAVAFEGLLRNFMSLKPRKVPISVRDH